MKAIKLNEQGHIVVLESYQALDGQIQIHEQDVPLVLDYMQHNPNADIQYQLADIQQWLKDNDYKINKHLLGEYADNDERWTTYLQERKVKLEQYNALEQQHVEKQPFDLTLLTPLVEEVAQVEWLEVTPIEPEPIEQEPLQIDTIEDDIVADEVTDQVVEDTEYIV